MAEVVEIGAWGLYGSESRKGKSASASLGCRPNFDNPRGECPPQTTKRLIT